MIRGSGASKSHSECSIHKLVRTMRDLFRRDSQRRLALRVCLLYTLLQMVVLPGGALASPQTSNVSRFTLECARQCARSDLHIYRDDILRCILDCCLVSRNLLQNRKELFLSDHLADDEHDHSSCRDHFRVQYERETERMRVLIPQKRRWGNTIAPCISSHCHGLSGERRMRCILQRCNLAPQ